MDHSYIQDDLELKALVLYILARAEGPVDLPDLTDIALCDGGFTYFDLAVALSELVGSGHAALNDQKYRITEKGRSIGAAAEVTLPSTVRMHCDQQLVMLNERFRLEQRVHAAVTRTPSGWQAELILDGEEDTLLTLTVLLPLEEDAQALVRRFRRDPEAFYESMMQEGDLF